MSLEMCHLLFRERSLFRAGEGVDDISAGGYGFLGSAGGGVMEHRQRKKEGF